MALSTTFTQYAPETAKFGKITQNKGQFAVQGHRFWYLAPFARYSLREQELIRR